MSSKPHFLLVLILFCTAAHASDGAFPSVEELTIRSDVIFTGTCLSWSSRWDERSRMIVTDAIFTVNRYIKGAGPLEVRVTSPGGVLPERNLEMTVTGMAQYARGEEVLIFATGAAPRNLAVYGMGRGKLTVQRDAIGTRRVRGEPVETVIETVRRIAQLRSRP